MNENDLLLSNRMQAELRRGFLTAAYLECGWLDRQEPLLQGFYSKDHPTGHVFDLASLTKALVTGPLVHQFLAVHQLSSFDSIRSWAADSKELKLPGHLLDLTADELLGHSSGLPAWWNFWINRLHKDSKKPSKHDRLDHIRLILTRIPKAADKNEIYSDVGYILLGYLLEILSAEDLATQFSRLLNTLAPSPFESFGFSAQLQIEKSNFVSTGICKIRERTLQGEVHDENSAALGGISGHAGLFGSGPDLARWLKVLYQSPEGFAYLQANEAVRLTTQRESLLGFRRGQGRSAANFCAGQGMGHLGFTGTAFWLELKSRKYAIFLSNRVISGRISNEMTDLRRDVFQLLDASFARI